MGNEQTLDPFEKITELTNERNDALERAQDGDRAQAKLDQLEIKHKSLSEEHERVNLALAERRKSQTAAENAAKDAESRALRAEEQLEAEMRANRSLENEVQKLREELAAGQPALDAANERADRAESEIKQAKEMVQGMIAKLEGLLQKASRA